MVPSTVIKNFSRADTDQSVRDTMVKRRVNVLAFMELIWEENRWQTHTIISDTDKGYEKHKL